MSDPICEHCAIAYSTGRDDERREIVTFLRNHARFAGFVDGFLGSLSAKETLEQKATQIENGMKYLCFDEIHEPSRERAVIIHTDDLHH